MNRFFISLLVVLSGTALANDRVYRWKDATGSEHYTNDLNTIPPNVSVVPTSGAEINEISTGSRRQPERKQVAQSNDSRRADAEARRAEAEARLAETQLQREETQNEAQWRALFRASRARVSSLQSELDRERAVVDDMSGLSASSRHSVYSSPCPPGSRCGPPVYAPNSSAIRVQQLESDLRLAVEELNELERRASFAAIPRHWRS